MNSTYFRHQGDGREWGNKTGKYASFRYISFDIHNTKQENVIYIDRQIFDIEIAF